ncbi:MAG: GNAT family N-acetyltransferase [Bacteroidota bacterium]
MQSTYDLRRIKSSTDRHITKALSIYSQNIDPLIRTDTREILYWLDNYNQHFTDRFYLVGLFLNDTIVGYAQFAYFKEERIIFIDYLAIDKQYRKNNTFYEFLEKLKEFFAEESLYHTYIIAEVGYYKENNVPTEITRNLIRLLKMSGFGVIKMTYYQPMLGRHNYETELSTILMLYTANDIKQIKKETYGLILDTIYYKHYKRWYDKFLSDKEQAIYITRLEQLRSKIEDNMKRKEYIEINGYASLFVTPNTAAAPKNYLKVAKLIAVAVIFAVISIGFGSIVFFAKKKFNLDSDSIKLISIFSLISVVFITSVLYNSKSESFIDTIERLIKLFKK